MNTGEFQAQAKYLNTIQGIGEKFIAHLRNCLETTMPDFLQGEHCTKTGLLLSFYGLRLVFRVEVFWQNGGVKPHIAAYRVTDDGEIPVGDKYFFDELGNVLTPNRGKTYESFCLDFVASVFTALDKEGITLRL